MERVIGNGIFWLATATAGATYGRFLPPSILVPAVMGALVTLLCCYVLVRMASRV